LRRELGALLACHDRAQSFLESTAALVKVTKMQRPSRACLAEVLGLRQAHRHQ
jgi:hypothetical protein